MLELSTQLLQEARHEAERFRHKYIRAEHLLLALLKDRKNRASHILKRVGVQYDDVVQQVGALACPVCDTEATMALSEGTKRSVYKALDFAGEEALNSRHLLYGVMQNSIVVRGLLERLDVDTELLLHYLQDRA